MELKDLISMEMSKKFILPAEEWKSIGKGLMVAVGGAFLTYITQVSTSVDFGQWTPVVVAGLSVLVNIGRKYLESQA